MKFSVKVMDKQGRESNNKIEAASAQVAIAELQNRGLVALSSPEMISETQGAAVAPGAGIAATTQAVASEGVKTFDVHAGVAARCGQGALLQMQRLRVDTQGQVSLVPIKQKARRGSGNATIAGGLAGGLVGAVAGALAEAAIDKAAQGGRLTIDVDVAHGHGMYDNRKRELSLELPDGRWLDVKFMLQGRARFDEALEMLQALYGDRLTPGPVGQQRPLGLGRIVAISILVLIAAIIACAVIAEYQR